MVHLTDSYANSPQAWFWNFNSTFAANHITWSLTKFHSALSKLPASLTDTIGVLCEEPAAISNPYGELLNILLRSLQQSASQKATSLLDHQGLGSNIPLS